MGKKKHYNYFKGYSECTDCAIWAAKALDKVIRIIRLKMHRPA